LVGIPADKNKLSWAVLSIYRKGELNYAKVKAHASKPKWKDTLADFWAFLGKIFLNIQCFWWMNWHSSTLNRGVRRFLKISWISIFLMSISETAEFCNLSAFRYCNNNSISKKDLPLDHL